MSPIVDERIHNLVCHEVPFFVHLVVEVIERGKFIVFYYDREEKDSATHCDCNSADCSASGKILVCEIEERLSASPYDWTVLFVECSLYLSAPKLSVFTQARSELAHPNRFSSQKQVIVPI